MDFEKYDDILVNCKDENEVQRYLENTVIMFLLNIF